MNGKYIALLRGINVGGHHKVPMAELRDLFKKMGFEDIETILNSGNIIFSSAISDIIDLELRIAAELEKAFGFAIPTIVQRGDVILTLIQQDPFHSISLTDDLRFYISFLKENSTLDIDLPWTSDDGSFQIISYQERVIVSLLDLSIAPTPKAMEALEKKFGKDITTRNWNTVVRLGKKISG